MRHYMKNMTRALQILLFIGLLAVPILGSSTDIKQAEDEIGSLEEDMKEVENLLSQLNQLKGNTERYVKQLDEELNQLYVRITELNGQMEATEAEIVLTKEALMEARQQEETQYSSMKLRIQYMYEKGETTYLDMLLSAASPSELLSRAEYISQISEYDRNMLYAYRDTKVLIEEKELLLEAEYASLALLKGEAEAKQSSVEKLIADKTKELEQYESEIQVAQEEIDRYQKDIEEQEAKIKQIEEEIRRKEAAAEASRKAAEEAAKKNGTPVPETTTSFTSGFIWPCPSSSRITSSFGSREAPVAGASSYHQGIDIGASTGANILAAASGEVVISTYSYSAGNYIMISHGDGVSTVYMHCSQLLVSVGDYVNQGAVIGLVGSTGYSTGPHLHFGVRVNGTYVDPMNYLK